MSLKDEILLGLRQIYAELKTGGDTEIISHLTVGQIDYCLFGNSNPFRIKIVNKLNDHHDYFYIKKADASRIYGLERSEEHTSELQSRPQLVCRLLLEK